ncbi:hypothetical protein F5Y19DRAFT_219693 [Xylariaceae sp. FL1651]|nr:hypothetical protein F5Y19DRAFT_219693 [Xylariaceae sp. FL1651]
MSAALFLWRSPKALSACSITRLRHSTQHHAAHGYDRAYAGLTTDLRWKFATTYRYRPIVKNGKKDPTMGSQEVGTRDKCHDERVTNGIIPSCIVPCQGQPSFPREGARDEVIFGEYLHSR